MVGVTLAGVLLLAGVSVSRTEASEPLRLYVAPNGNDVWSGRLTSPNRSRTDGPFATIDRARREVRKAKHAPGVGGIVVEVAPGVYQLSEPIEFSAEDSGTPDCPIEYRAAKKGASRVLCGGFVSGWRAVTDPNVRSRLSAEARRNTVCADLLALGITDLQGIGSAQTYQSDPGLEVFYRDRPMTLARYPNAGYLYVTEAFDAEGNPQPPGAIVQSHDVRFRCNDPRVTTWLDEHEVWLHGFWVYDWADLRVRVLGIDPDSSIVWLGDGLSRGYGLRTGQWFYAENVLAELDSPGEWYLDRNTGLLYFWPPAELRDNDVVVSTVRDPIRMREASRITFRGLVVEAGRGTAFRIEGGEDVLVVACTVRNMGNWAVRVTGGSRHGVVGCDIYQTGQGGIYLEGGDRKSLTPGGHYARNNHIHHTARWDPVYQQAIALQGVGNSATNNLIENVPHIAVGFSGNDMTIDFNEIHTAVFQSNDAGAIYTSPPDETWSMRGHKIRSNYLHNIHGFEGRGCNGVYLDDCFSSAEISRNIFYDVATAVLIGGGRDNIITDNMFINCGRALSIDARGLGWASSVGVFATKELHDLNYQEPPWSERYPELVGILEDQPLAPKGNVVARNICWGSDWGWFEQAALELIRFEDNLIGTDPRFVGEPADGFRLAPDSPAWTVRFRAPQFSRIGVYASRDRATWPVARSRLREGV